MICLVIVLNHGNLIIKYREDRKRFEVALKYTKFKNALENLHKTNIIYSTYKIPGHIDGFVKLERGLFLRISIIHQLGAIVTYNRELERTEAIKMKVRGKPPIINWTIDKELLNKSSKEIINVKTKFRHEDLKEFYLDLSITSNIESIVEKQKIYNRVPMKDFAEASRFNYSISPNMDGNRSRLEYLAGSGSNIGRKRFY